MTPRTFSTTSLSLLFLVIVFLFFFLLFTLSLWLWLLFLLLRRWLCFWLHILLGLLGGNFLHLWTHCAREQLTERKTLRIFKGFKSLDSISCHRPKLICCISQEMLVMGNHQTTTFEIPDRMNK